MSRLEHNTYHQYLAHAREIDSLIDHLQLSSVLLATLKRLYDKAKKAMGETQQDWFMQSEFSGIGIEQLVELKMAAREKRSLEWHPNPQESAYYYAITAKGTDTVKEAIRILTDAGVKFYY